MSVYKAEDYQPTSFSEGYLTISDAMTDPASVQLYYNENGKYYVTAESVMNYMIASATTEINEAIEKIAEVNEIEESSIECVGQFDPAFRSASDSVCEAVVLEKSVEDDAMSLKKAKQFYKKTLKTCKTEAETVDQIDECIKMLKSCLANMEKERKTAETVVTNGRVKYSLKALIPFNGIYRFFKRHDWMGGLGSLAGMVIPGIDMYTRAGSYKQMLDGMIKDTKEAIAYLEDKKKMLQSNKGKEEK